MNIQEIEKRNEKLQEQAAQCAEAVPGHNLVEYASIIIRSMKKIDVKFPKLLQAKSDMTFYTTLEKLEEEIDEVVYALDKLHGVNRKSEILQINELIKNGYELLSIYSMACDAVIEKRVKVKEQEEEL